MPGTKNPPPSLDALLARHHLAPLRRGRLSTLQVNLGKVCNQACHHCHVDAGPKRTESMDRRTAERVMGLLAASPQVETVDLTGGAPELNSSFRWIVEAARHSGHTVLDRCNLTVLLEPGQEDLAAFLAAHQVHVIASLPCYLEENVDRQRGRGVFEKSIEALRRLNALGYGRPGSGLKLDLVYNPQGPSLPPPQTALESQYKDQLRRRFGIEFNNLLALANMPIERFARSLDREGRRGSYLSFLADHFNPETAGHVMCRTLASVGWDGQIYDCDFNQMLGLPVGREAGTARRTIWDVETLKELEDQPITTGPHCLGCTAGAGSGCSGALREAAA